ncbi:hypothetical protein KM043_005716 [Ampulex compressa]|nr:hypothetical protein KM043_005716 [Ampulex compressa]
MQKSKASVPRVEKTYKYPGQRRHSWQNDAGSSSPANGQAPAGARDLSKILAHLEKEAIAISDRRKAASLASAYQMAVETPRNCLADLPHACIRLVHREHLPMTIIAKTRKSVGPRVRDSKRGSSSRSRSGLVPSDSASSPQHRQASKGHAETCEIPISR